MKLSDYFVLADCELVHCLSCSQSRRCACFPFFWVGKSGSRGLIWGAFICIRCQVMLCSSEMGSCTSRATCGQRVQNNHIFGIPEAMYVLTTRLFKLIWQIMLHLLLSFVAKL